MIDDKNACAELIQAWGFYRDQGKWPQLLSTFVPRRPDQRVLVQRELPRIRGSLPQELRKRTAFQASDLSIRGARRRGPRTGGNQCRHPGAPEDRRRAGRHDLLRTLPRPPGADGWILGDRRAHGGLRARPARPGRAVGSIREAVQVDRPFGLSRGLPLHGRAARRRRPRAGARGPLRRLPAHRAAPSALRSRGSKGSSAGQDAARALA